MKVYNGTRWLHTLHGTTFVSSFTAPELCKYRIKKIEKQQAMTTFKTILSGRLEFGSPKSYEKVLKMYQQRMETHYRTAELMFKLEEVFHEPTSSLDIPRMVIQSNEKSWQNTLNLLEYVAQFAIAGDLRAWMTDNGKVLKYHLIEPKSDKGAVQFYLKGREMVKNEGMENEARAALSSAIEKYERHAAAYERRGYVNFQLKNYADALYDYTKSIDLNPNHAEPFLGRAFVKMVQQDWKGATQDLEQAIKRSIPHEPIYWKARRVKGECHLKIKEFEQAATELKFFTGRTFQPEDSNYKWRQKAWFNYGKALSAVGKFNEALQAFDHAMQIQDSNNPLSISELEPYKQAALQKTRLEELA
jgi:tetratricopeptide (TPR) repeat protein